MTNLQFLITGAFLGLTAGISPGPLLTLVITETLKYGRAGGIKVALSPLVTDLPIILFTLFIISELPGTDAVLGIISLAGCAFVAFLAYESIKTNGLEAHFSEEASQSLKKGIIANFLNPHPYLFWLTVGTSYMMKATQEGVSALVMFLVSFYLMLTGSKVGVAVIVSHSGKMINNKLYVFIMRFLGLVLFVFSIMLFREGIMYLLS